MKTTPTLIASLVASGGLVLIASAFGGGGSTPVKLVMGDGVRALAIDDATFVNYETPHVHPLELSGDGSALFAVNTAAGSLEIFSVVSGIPRQTGSVPVGVDPVSVRQRTASEVWVVNHISDSISVVDLARQTVVRTIQTADEPADVVFTRGRAFVSCAQANLIQVFDAANPTTPTDEIKVEAEDPRALAVSPDGQTVYAAIFESGNRTTILGGGSAGPGTIGFPPNAVNSPVGPYNGVNPPPNDGASFSPPINAANPPAPRVGLIVKQNEQGNWLDDNQGDWTSIVTGPDAAVSGRLTGWTLLDHDVAIIDADSLSLGYQDHLMNINMAMAVNPATGQVAVVGTEATNETRFEPNLNGRFVRTHGAVFNPGGAASVLDLNPHLSYPAGHTFTPIVQTERDRSLGDPRGVAFNASGTRAYVTGMGSNNVAVFDGSLARVGPAEQIEVGQGPTGIVVDDARSRLYVLNKFDGSISTVDLNTHAPIGTTPFFDPTPPAIKLGRPFLYDTHRTSGLGQTSCASCHVDARFDRLAWDLGDPAGAMKGFNQNCLDGNCQDWHPMKGPMSTQTMQDIVGKEPHHWRGDRDGIEEFNGAFVGLLGDDTLLTALEMQQFEDFLATIRFGPNPFRSLTNRLPQNLDLDGHFTVGRFAPAGQPMPAGNAQAAVNPYRTAGLDGGLNCVTCHTFPTGQGTNFRLQGLQFVEVPPGPNGETHNLIVSVDGSTNVSIKVPQTRNMHEKTGFNTTQLTSTAGFGYLHDGSVDSIERFIAEPAFSLAGPQQFSNLVALMLAFSGSDLFIPANPGLLEPPGPPSNDAHAAVGKQWTLSSGAEPADLNTVRGEADLARVGLIVKGEYNGELRGFEYLGAGGYQSDRAAEIVTHADLLAAAAVGSELTWTVVDWRTSHRLGVDRDTDGYLDRDEADVCADASNELSTPLNSVCCPADFNGDGILDNGDIGAFVALFLAGDLAADINGDNVLDNGDIGDFVTAFLAGC